MERLDSRMHSHLHSHTIQSTATSQRWCIQRWFQTRAHGFAGADLGGVYAQPVSHGEGRFYASVEVAKELFANGQVATRYCDADGNISMDEAININGSVAAIEGITSKDGRVFGKMAHPERIGKSVAVNIAGNQDMKIFESGVKYFK